MNDIKYTNATRQAVRDILEKFKRMPEIPVTERDTHLFPHLSPKEIRGLFVAARKTKRHDTYFAFPSILVRGAFQILTLRYHHEDDFHVKERGATPDTFVLTYAYSGRVCGSYKHNEARQGDTFNPYFHTKEALAYANEHYGDDLIDDTWVDVCSLVIQNPREHNERGYPTTVCEIMIGVDAPWNDIINKRSDPQYRVIDKNIVVMSHDAFEKYEIKGGRGGFTDYNCSLCGAGLGLSGCTGCLERFKDDQFRCGWGTPLPPKVVKYLIERGHTFEKPVEAEWAKAEGTFTKLLERRLATA